jgi:hypothetical protein
VAKCFKIRHRLIGNLFRRFAARSQGIRGSSDCSNSASRSSIVPANGRHAQHLDIRRHPIRSNLPRACFLPLSYVEIQMATAKPRMLSSLPCF